MSVTFATLMVLAATPMVEATLLAMLASTVGLAASAPAFRMEPSDGVKAKEKMSSVSPTGVTLGVFVAELVRLGDAEAAALSDAVVEGVTVGVAVTLTVELDEGVSEGVGVPVMDGAAPGESEDVGVGEGVEVMVLVVESDGERDGVGEGVEEVDAPTVIEADGVREGVVEGEGVGVGLIWKHEPLTPETGAWPMAR